MQTNSAEFDGFDGDYKGGMEDPLKRLIGRNLDVFIRIKVNKFLSILKATQIPENSESRLLDYGCGSGDFLALLKAENFGGTLAGCDVSKKMLSQAESNWSEHQRPVFNLVNNNIIDFDSSSFDIVTTSCVFHHIEPNARDFAFKEILRVLKPGGLLVLFEHNPFNPLTRFMVKRCPIDKNAVLLTTREVRNRMVRAGFKNIKSRYFMFFPPRLSFLFVIENLLEWLPLGGQFVGIAQKQD